MDLLKTLSPSGDFATPIVDAHHHLWDLKAGHYPTKTDQYDKNFFLGDYRAICRDYMPSDYVEALKGFRVVGSVHIQAARAMDEQVAETEWLGTMNAQFGLPSVAVGHVSFIQPDCAGDPRGPCEVAADARHPFAAHDIAGTDGVGRGRAGHHAGRSLAAELRAAGEARHVVGHAHSLLAPRGGRRGRALLPGHSRWWSTTPACRSTARRKGSRSGARACGAGRLPERGDQDLELGLPHGKWDVPSNIRVVREAASIFGPDRIIFASNLPVASLSTTFGGIVAVMREALAEETPETLAKFFAKNAIRFYRMPIQLP